MPSQLSYPGVYVEEIPSGVRTIAGVSTSLTAFVGRARSGPVDEPVLIHGVGDFERIFGGLWALSPMSFAVQQYFANGGADALIVRVFNGDAAAILAATATFDIPGGLTLRASSPGAWASSLRISIDDNTRDPSDTSLVNITVSRQPPGGPPGPPFDTLETLRNVSLSSISSSFVTKFLQKNSAYIRVEDGSAVPATLANASFIAPTPGAEGDDGPALDNAALRGSVASKRGVGALEKADLFNLLCLPPPAPGLEVDSTTYSDAAKYCGDRRAFLIVDAPPVAPAVVDTDAPALVTGSGKKNAAVFYPRLRLVDPLSNPPLVDDYVPCGAVAGIFARTDAQRGVWKAPAGIDAGVNGAQGLTVTLTDPENGTRNLLGINCLRTFPLVGSVVWGSRTMEGADALASEWKYVPVRRTALFIEESLYRGLKWVVFEPNDAPLWAQIRLNVGAFMQNLFRQGAFQGSTPRDAYFVRCGPDTTTQTDINLGIVNILVGFAPLKPAEFVVLKIQQMAGQIAT